MIELLDKDIKATDYKWILYIQEVWQNIDSVRRKSGRYIKDANQTFKGKNDNI